MECKYTNINQLRVHTYLHAGVFLNSFVEVSCPSTQAISCNCRLSEPSANFIYQCLIESDTRCLYRRQPTLGSGLPVEGVRWGLPIGKFSCWMLACTSGLLTVTPHWFKWEFKSPHCSDGISQSPASAHCSQWCFGDFPSCSVDFTYKSNFRNGCKARS